MPASPHLPSPFALPGGMAASTTCWAVIPCAGTGSRAVLPSSPAATLPKQYQPVAGQPMVLHTLAAFAGVSRLRGVLVAVAAGDRFLEAYPHPSYFAVPCGGPTRAETVLGGLRALRERGAQPGDWVLVHDAARCLITLEAVDRLIDACLHDPVGGLLGHKLPDTLKVATEGPGGARVLETVDRSDKWLAQTPQMFRLGQLTEALEKMGATATDEASAIEGLGLHPRLVMGGAQNFKVTYPEDFALAAAVLAQRAHQATLDMFGGVRGHAAPEPERSDIY